MSAMSAKPQAIADVAGACYDDADRLSPPPVDNLNSDRRGEEDDDRQQQRRLPRRSKLTSPSPPSPSRCWRDPKHWIDLCPLLTISGGKGDCENKGDGSSDDGMPSKRSKKTASVLPAVAEPAAGDDAATVDRLNDGCGCGNPAADEDEDEGEGVFSTAAERERLSSDLLADGYALIPRGVLDATDDDGTDGRHATDADATNTFSALSSSIDLLRRRGYPATFVLLYDEVWQVARRAGRVLRSLTHGKNVLNFDMLAFHVDPSRGEVGFSPHRDRQPCDVRSSFHAPPVGTNDENMDDTGIGHAKYVTLWLALRDATPENGCLYLIPRPYDPGYVDGDVDDPDVDPLTRALPTKESYQNIRAIPRRAGEAVAFTHRTLHWGGRGNWTCEEPRIALSFVSSDPDYERPYVDSTRFGDILLPPPFEVRLLLACSQLLVYHERFHRLLPPSTVRACYEICKEHGHMLEPTYRNKVLVEFVGAMREARQRPMEERPVDTDEGVEAAASEVDDHIDNGRNLASATERNDGVVSPRVGDAGTGVDENDQNDDYDDDEDAMLEEMLDADAGGYGDFKDDFDDIDERAGGGEDGGGGEHDSEEEDYSDDEEERRSGNSLLCNKTSKRENVRGATKTKHTNGGDKVDSRMTTSKRQKN